MRLAHRVQSSATPAQVWRLLGDPRRWPEFNPVLRRVHGAPERARTGHTLLSVARFTGLRIPVDVVEAVPERRLELFFHTAPGVSERVVFELTPTVRGGCALRASVVVEGLFARAAFVPLWLANGLVARLLAVRAERLARQERSRSSGAA
ncbi:MAG TPA: SRPBCC family protein [Mycobacteriales bacterium]|nr:SRPBCC family protein [Mycobacteriales bacterium]